MSGGTKAVIVSAIAVTVVANAIFWVMKFKKAIIDFVNSAQKTSEVHKEKNDKKVEVITNTPKKDK